MEAEIYSFEDKIRPVKSIEFGILSNKTIRDMSALDKNSVGIDIADLYENTEEKRNGLIDPRLGSNDNYKDCATCGLNNTYCNGHFGHIELAEPVFHIGYLRYIVKILSCICIKCSKLLVYKNENEIMDMLKNKSGKNRMAEIRNAVKKVTYCQKKYYGCGTPVSKIKLEIKKTIGAIIIKSEISVASTPNESSQTDGKKKIIQILTPDIVHDILKNISDTDCRILGLDPKKSRPEDMIHKIFPVPPVQVRPSARADFMGSSTLEDDLTHKLADIVKRNITMRRYKETMNELTAKYANDHLHLLQYHCATYIDNESISLPKADQKGKILKSLSSRLKGKDGRIRANLMGKRVDFSGRTVITSDPTISINQLGVPIDIAMELTFPEVVTIENIEYLTKLVRNGKDKYPGANFVFPASGFKIGKRVLPVDLRYRKDKVELRYGDVVERHLIDNDIVLVNRQPTLHKQSMMGHRIKVLSNPAFKTFRLSVTVTTPYNADFDGDEMNIFIPQSIQTQIELEEITDVRTQVIDPGTSRTIIGIVQDGLIGSYNLTAPDMRIDWRNVMNIISYTSFDDFKKIKKYKEYTGQEIFSTIIPNKINITKGNTKIVDGVLIEGYLNKDFLGAKKKGAIHQLIWDEYGAEQTQIFLDNTQRLINNFNMYNGFSVGIGDIIDNKELLNEINNRIQSTEVKTQYMITEVENNPDLMTHELYERTLYADYNVIRDDVSKIVMSKMPPKNGFIVMNASGAKGDSVNMAKMGGCPGQQAFEAKLIPKKINQRTLPYYFQNDDRAKSRGFVHNNYLHGVDFEEFVYINMAGRAGLIDQAVKSVTGDTSITIMENNINKVINIGDWIDDLLQKFKNKVIFDFNNRELELLNLESPVTILTCNEIGVVSRQNITAVTRHNPGKELYEIKTRGNRSVIVTESKSLIIWNNYEYKFEEKLTTDVVIGDFVPAINEFLSIYDQVLSVNDVMLDKIIEINKIGIEKYPKVYDITVPSTLNFALTNGLIVRDTAQSGYLQRKIVKSSEDAIIKYDGTVRTATNSIIQFIYGDSGTDTTKQSEYDMKIMLMGDKEITEKYKIKENDLDKYDITKKENNDYVKKIIEMRDLLRMNQIKSKMEMKVLETIFMLPVNLNRIIDGRDKNIKETKNDPLTAKYILNKLDQILNNDFTKLMCIRKEDIHNEKSYKYRDEQLGKNAFKIALHSSLAPAVCFYDLKINKNQFDIIINDIVVNYNKNIVEPGEMVGVIGAQSLGEPATQMTINSIDWNEKIYVKNFDSSKTCIYKIGMWIDDLVNDPRTVHLGDNNNEMGDIHYLNIADKNMYIQSITENGIIMWKKIEAVTKHLPINADGTDTLIKIKTKTNKKVIATKGKSFLTKINDKIVPIRGDQLYIGITVPVINKNTNTVYHDPITSIIETKPSHKYVYDLTVEDTKTFCITNGLCLMDSFHSSGVGGISNTTQGVPRMNELLSLSKKIKTPQMQIYLTDEYLDNKEMANKIASHIKYTTLGHIRKNISVYYDPFPNEKGGFMEMDNVKNIYYTHTQNKLSCQENINNLIWLMRIELDREKMLEKEVTLLEIKSKFCNLWEKRYNDFKNIKKEEKYVIENITQLAVLSNNDNDLIPVIHIRFNMEEYDLSIVNDFIMYMIDKFKLKGISSVSSVDFIKRDPMISFDKDTHEKLDKYQYIIYTNGINLIDIRFLNGINNNKVICNDVVSVFKTFGIEAARAILIRELTTAYVIAGLSVNYQHITNLADTMTLNGNLTSIDRHGINKSDIDPLSRASFEKTVDQLITAAVFGEVDYMKGVSSRIIAGLVVTGGTGMPNILLDTDMLENSEYIEDIEQKYEKTFVPVNDNEILNLEHYKTESNIFIPNE